VKAIAARSSPSLVGGRGFAEVSVTFKNFADEASELRRLVNRYSGDLALKEKTLEIIRAAGAASRHELDQALAIGEWVQRSIYYVHEGRETFQRPETTLRLEAGDCDDFTLLICSMLGTVGIREKMCILKINGKWAHIFPVAVVIQDHQAHRLTLDATLDRDRYPIRDLVNPIALVRGRGDTAEPLFV
jgi:hypothetical protein